MEMIVAATDGSEASDEAVSVAVELALEHEAQIIFVHVIPAVEMFAANPYLVGSTAIPHEPTPHDFAVLDAAVAAARKQGVNATSELITGFVVPEIVALAEAHNADLTVVGSRGHGAVVSGLLGSISRGVINASSRPVVVVHAKPIAH